MSKITEDFRISALRRGIVVRPSVEAATADHLLNAASLEMANLGFIVRPQDLAGISAANLALMFKDARKVIGADRNMTPIYPGFPAQVEALDTLTLFVEQILHYWTAGAFLPDYPSVVRESLDIRDMLRSGRKVQVLTASKAAFSMISELSSSPVALSEDDRTLLEGSMDLRQLDFTEIAKIAKAARNGENLQVFVGGVYGSTNFTVDEILGAVVPACDNLDQLLRVVLTLVSSPSDPKWEKNYHLAVGTLANRHARAVRLGRLSRPARRLIVARMAALSAGFKADSLVARRDLWRSVLRTAHVYDLGLNTLEQRVADIVHSNIEYRTLNSQIEAAMESADVFTAVKLLSENQPGGLLRRLVAILRLARTDTEVNVLADAVKAVGSKSTPSTLISSYNGVISANDSHVRVTRVAGLNNTMVERKDAESIKDEYVAQISTALKIALSDALRSKVAPSGAVAVLSDVAVPLVRRDASTSDRVLDRGQELDMVGEGDILRIFGHWNNNQKDGGYMDIGAVVLDDEFKTITVSTWNAWMGARDWSTYSGDKLVYPKDSAAEYIDVKLDKLRASYPSAKWVAMTVQSWNGWPIADVDFIAGAMLRSDGQSGEVFDARTVATAFKPTTASTQAVPFAVNLETGRMFWIDSSNGSTEANMSSTNDDSIGDIVYDELARPRLTMGELATLWAEAHGAATVDLTVNRDEILSLLG